MTSAAWSCARPGSGRRRWDANERPLGPAAAGWVASDDLYRAILHATPYRVRGLVGFGANLLLSHADAANGAAALRASNSTCRPIFT